MSISRPLIAVYMVASRPQGTLYTGVTSDLYQRVRQHRDGEIAGFTRRYRCKSLVWWEEHGDMVSAIAHEKRIKKYPRDWKTNLIQRENPHWRDLYPALIADPALDVRVFGRIADDAAQGARP